ncbi:hypothetical protein MML48_1g12569 [Holotrichia oblita]|uniref:Uncharacterized protein n=1 Tax=Holotrichia oblita TaxID=644536 RepID=A0ACB9TTK5_HOLOL|nr:hypothetical protein MML48_1g12569 [Holotrichia oblita]
MQFKYVANILDTQEIEYQVVALAWSPNNYKLAAATIGEKWGEKKAICNKFLQSAPVTCITWLLTGPIICGLSDGKVRALQIKSNKSQSLYASESFVVSLCSNSKGTGFLSGHIDGNVIRFFITDDERSQDTQGRVLLHSVPPCALAWLQGQIFVGGCDKRVVFYSNQGKILKQFDYSRDTTEHEFTVACGSPSGQAVVVGSFDRLRVYAWNPKMSIWEETAQKDIKNLYTVTALAWKRDGFRVAVSNLGGSILFFETVLRRSIWKDKYEITFVGPSQVLIKHLQGEHENIIVSSNYGNEIEDIKIMGRDNYIVARTSDTIIIGDLVKNMISEVLWNNSGKHEKFYFDNTTVCLVFNAGELSLVEYGDNEVLCSVRTEFANPHLISVRLNERNSQTNNKKLAYLLDLKTVCIMDLISGIIISQINHESKIDWLELSETGHKLLFRDVKQRLMLVDVNTSEKKCIFSSVSFIQWVESSDVAVAQSGTALAVWYNIDLPEHPTIMTVKGDVVDIIRNNGRTQVVAVDGNNTMNFELDEGLVEFGTAIHDNDYSRAVLFLETIGNSTEAEAMWHNLTNIALKQQDLFLIKRSYAGMGNISKVLFLQQTEEIGQKFVENTGEDMGKCPEVWARLAILNGDLDTAENIYLEQVDIESALNMYKRLHKWDAAIRLAKKSGYQNLSSLKDEHMKMLLNTGQFEKAGQVLEEEGNYEQAMSMYIKSNRLFLTIKFIWYIWNAYNIHFYLFLLIGKVWNKAVELARMISPDQVVSLEEEWGDHLVENKQMDAAISHYIEAGRTHKALDAAVSARQWKKAVHIIQVIDDDDSVRDYYNILGKHYASAKEYGIAESMYIKADMFKEAVEMYNEAGQWEKAHNLASKYLDQSEVTSMYIKQAEELETLGKYREAERLYLSVDEADLAIAMYKRVEQYENMIRLVERFHPDLLPTTHLHLAQQMEMQGKYRAAEVHFLAVGDWKAATNMYRTLGMWEEAYRVAKQSGGSAAANQVAFLWAKTLPIDSAIKLLNKYGILEACVDYACETYQYEFAFQLCKNLQSKVNEVHYKYAMALEDDGKFAEAEAEFILAEKPREAVLMYTHGQNWINALRIAEAHEPSAVTEVLQAQAAQCFLDGQFAEFESLLLRAQMPELIVQKYKSSDMWVEALRVCRDYLPTLLPSLQAEYSNSSHNKTSAMDLETLLSRANEWALAGQHKQAIDCLLQVNTNIAEPSIVRRALLRASDMVNKFLFGQDAVETIKVLSPRLIEIQEHTVAAQLYVSIDVMKDAIDTFILAEDWTKARKLAKELEPAYESYIESRYKDRLLTDGNIEQLADVDIIGALDLLVEQGQWTRCIEKAKSHSAPVLHKYVAIYASHLIKDKFTLEAMNLYTAHGVPAMPQNFNVYNQMALNIFSMPNTSGPDSYNLWAQLRQILYELNEGIDIAANIELQHKIHFRTLLLIAHYYSVRALCKQVPSLKNIAVKISVALLRYTDILPADKAFYEAGIDLRDEGRVSEAFVFLNHYLDICEAIEDGESQLVDHTDFGQTDFPSNIPVPEHLYLEDNVQDHDNVREWVLAISMDQNVDQTLPLDDRQIYESCLQHGENPCLITGYPLGNQVVSFSKSSYEVNKDAWSKLNMAAKMYPDTNANNLITFMHQWLGTPTK